MALGCAGLCSYTRPLYDKALGLERCQMVQKAVRAEVEEECQSRTVAMHQQGAWANWDGAVARKIT